MLSGIKNFYKIYGYYYFKIWSMHLIVLFSPFFIDIKYFAYSFILFLFYMPMIQLIFHEYVSHNYIRPKNKLIDLLCLLFLYVNGISVKSKREYHINHHRHWKNSELDPTQQKIQGVSMFKYVFALQKPIAQNLEPVKNVLVESNQWVKLFDNHVRKIYWIYILTIFLTLNLSWFFVLAIYVPWILIISGGLHDQVFHGSIKSKDHAWYLPIFGSQAWHIRHHEQYRTWFHGPGFWKWFNIAWYYQLLLFDDNKIGVM